MFLRTIGRLFSIIAASLAALFIGVSVFSGLTVPPRLIAMFDSGVPGTAASYDALKFAAEADIDLVINYSAVNADTRSIEAYLQYAQQLGRQVVVSLMDFVGPEDADPANRHYHDQYGSTNDERVANMVRSFESIKGHEAVWGYLIADEPVIDPKIEFRAADVAAMVKIRYDQIKALTSKPAMVTHWRLPGSDLETLAKVTDHLMMDYYPYPEGEGQKYGPVKDIQPIARDMRAAAGPNNWFALQAFSYYVSEPHMIEQFHFPSEPPRADQGAPDTDLMVDMARSALAGGARHLAFFSYGYARQVGDHQLENLKAAVKEVRGSIEFRSGFWY